MTYQGGGSPQGGWPQDPFQQGPFQQDPFVSGPPPPVTWGMPVPAGGPPQKPEPKRRRRVVIVAVTLVTVLVVGLTVWGLLWRFAGSSAVPAAASSTTAAPDASPSPRTTHTKPIVQPLGALRPPRNIQLNPTGIAPADRVWTVGPHNDAPPAPDDDQAVVGGDSYLVMTVSRKGFMALNTETGEAMWPERTMPPGSDKIVNYATKCTVDRADVTVACKLGDSTSTRRVVFFDVDTGAVRNTFEAPAPGIMDLSYAGDGFVVTETGGAIIGFHADGSVAWTANNDMAGMKIAKSFGDQGIVFSGNGQVLDANSGAVLASTPGPLAGGSAFASGFALEGNDGISFYDFTGKKTASLQGYVLPNPLDGFNDWTSSSGTYDPLVIDENAHVLAQVDPATGQLRWSRTLSEQMIGPNKSRPAVAGSEKTCFALVNEADRSSGDGRYSLMVQDCATQSDNPFSQMKNKIKIRGFDGQHFLWQDGYVLRSVDIATAQEAWNLPAPTIKLEQFNTMLPSTISYHWVGAALYADFLADGGGSAVARVI